MDPAHNCVSLYDADMADKWFGDGEDGEHDRFFIKILCDLMNKEHCDFYRLYYYRVSGVENHPGSERLPNPISSVKKLYLSQ